ncbi:MAG: caspase family protein [Anaerolineales bacterium]
MTNTFTHGHAIVIGVGADLPTTIDDATGLADILKDPGRCAYPEKQVAVLTGEGARRKHILSALSDLAKQTSADSTVVVYFSGHGYQVKERFGRSYFIMPFGYSIDELTETAISGAELSAALGAIKAQKMLLLLDCCHAGGLDEAKAPGLTLSKAPLPAEAPALLAQGAGRIIIASSTSDELSYAGKPYSAFTLAVVEALAGKGVAKQDGYVRASDLALYAREMVPRRTTNKQHPVLNFEQADNFVVAYYAGGDAQPKALPFTEAEVEIEAEPGQTDRARMQAGRDVISDVGGSVLSGTFQGPVQVGGSGPSLQSAGDINIGGDFVGRDKVTTTHHFGDSITTGDISGSGVAIGRGARASVSGGLQGPEFERLFATLLQAAAKAEPAKLGPAMQTVQELKEEVKKGDKADDGRVGKLIDQLVGLVPGAVSAVVGAFGTPILGGLAGPVTKFVLDKIQGK